MNTPDKNPKVMPLATGSDIELLYVNLLSRTATEEEVKEWVGNGLTVDAILKHFASSDEFVVNNENVVERLDKVAQFLTAYFETDWSSAKVHATSHYLKYCDWTRFTGLGLADLLTSPMASGVQAQETRIATWLLDARELYSELEVYRDDFAEQVGNLSWQISLIASRLERLEKDVKGVIQQSPEGDRALLTEILLRLDRINDALEDGKNE